MQGAVKRRDAEIQRLAIKAEKGPDANQMNLRFKNETNESIILQLNSQASGVNFLRRAIIMIFVVPCLGHCALHDTCLHDLHDGMFSASV